MPPRIGVFICHCGRNIGAVVNVPEVVDYTRGLPGVVHAEENLYTCSEDTQDEIVETIKENHLNRVVVASCSPRTHEPLFQETIRKAGLNPYLFTMTNIRDQDSWVHMNFPREATEKAKDLVKMAVSRASLLKPLHRQRLPVNKTALVIGGGVAGMTAALDLAGQGFDCHLVERDKELGGMSRNIYRDLKGNDISAYLRDLTEKVRSEPRIHLHTSREVVDAEGFVGNFKTTIGPVESGTPTEEKEAVIEHGVVIIATGAEEYRPQEYLYGKNPAVLTQTELEKLVVKGADSLKDIGEVVMIQCVGSRTDERPYCSRVCCGEAVKNALLLREGDPKRRVFVLYRDIRTYSFQEAQYSRARDAGVIFLRYDPERPPHVYEENGEVVVELEDELLGRTLVFDPDLLVLSAATLPNPDNQRISRLYKVPINEDGFFLEAHMKLRPVDFSTEGVYMCGTAGSPKYIPEAVAEAHAASSRAATVLSRETIETEGTVAGVEEILCTGCGNCVELCAYAAVEIDPEKGIAAVNPALCKGCGTCVAGCRCGAMVLEGFDDREIAAELDALLT